MIKRKREHEERAAAPHPLRVSPSASSTRPHPQSQARSTAVEFLKRRDLRADSLATTSSLDNRRSSSVESGNAQQWFDRSNNNARESSTFRVARGSPFDIQHQQDPELEAASLAPNPFSYPAILPFRGGMHPAASLNENIEDYRSVIDDLTIRNQRLKTKLKSYEHKQEQLDSEKLFEVRMQGLSAFEKRELQDMLTQFVRNLDHPPAPDPPSLSTEPTNLAGLSKIAAPNTSYPSTKFADSGYGSLATSNQGLSQRGSMQPSSINRVTNGIEASKARNRNIQSYLHDIPEGLLPRQSPTVMTEQTKKKIIVARLEQLFLGRGAATGGHQQPIQQQEVSQSAARDDISAIEACGQSAVAEGRREACIMSPDFEESIGSSAVKDRNDTITDHNNHSNQEKSSEHSPVEQRPTRPLDLDPQRAQDPKENIGYLSHLGFDGSNNGSAKQFDIEREWVYLNLVINMAQLHTLNVTNSLVKDAITDYSSRFELSPDGRKIRWCARPIPTLRKSDSTGESSNISSQGGSSGQRARRERRVQVEASSPFESSDPPIRNRQAALGSFVTSHNVNPYLSQPETSEAVEDSEMYDDISGPPFNGADGPFSPDSSAWTSSGNLYSQLGQPNQHDDGPIIFYKSQKFFTDMGGDRAEETKPPRLDYTVKPMRPLGSRLPDGSAYAFHKVPSTASVQAAVSSASLDVNHDMKGTQDAVSVRASNEGHVSSHEPYAPMPFTASGLGCIYPDDNFAVFVTRRTERAPCPPSPKRRRLSRLQDLIDVPLNTSHVFDYVTSVSHKQMRPSSLPPPTYAVSTEDSGTDSDDEEQPESGCEYGETSALSGDSDEISDAAVSFEPESDGDEPLHDAPSMESENDSEPNDIEDPTRRMYKSASHPAFHQATDAIDGGSTSPSDIVDLLESARRADPQAIQKREREYDAELAERLAEELSAGSSAATCGDRRGSGYTSPLLDGRVTDIAREGCDENEDMSVSS